MIDLFKVILVSNEIFNYQRQISSRRSTQSANITENSFDCNIFYVFLTVISAESLARGSTLYMYVTISHLACKHEFLTVSKTTSSSLRAYIPLPGKPFHRQNILENYQNKLLASFSVGKHSAIDHFQNPMKVHMIHQLLVRELHYHLVVFSSLFSRVAKGQ